MNCKVRFAPSPTGFMHIGNARVAIINYLFCRKNDGRFLFRIDDTDSQRSKKEYEDAIRYDMDWLGISYDETFRQSERLERYREVMENLVSSGALYKCYESQEELEYKRKLAISKGRPPVYDRSSLNLTSAEMTEFERAGRTPYWRFKLPPRVVSWNDLILGDVSYDLRNVSDPVIIKADGTFLYTFSSVVDDFDSGITHIIRGQDHVTNTAVQIALFDEISGGKFLPEFAHLSLLVNKDGSQFSKRLGSMNLSDIREHGVDPMAVFDLLATFGSSLDTRPFTDLEDLIEYFDLSKFSKNSPKFDVDDIFKINRKIICSRPYSDVKQYGLSEREFLLVRENIESYNDFSTWKRVLASDYVPRFKPSVDEQRILSVFSEQVSGCFAPDEIFGQVSAKTGMSGRKLYLPIRMALTDMEYGPHMPELIEFFGRSDVLRRCQCVLSGA